MRLKLGAAFAVAFALLFASCQGPSAESESDPGKPQVVGGCGVGPKLVPTCGAWWGVAANPLSGETWDRALVNFESQIGRTVNIAHFYHRAGELFPTPSEIARANEPGKNRMLLINYKPEAGRSWYDVSRGSSNDEIDRLAAHINANFTKPFFLTVHHEPEDEVIQTPGSGFTASDYKAMYRHVVVRLRQRGVRNIVSVMNYMGLPSWGSQPWFQDLYPGNDVVDWIAYDPYIFGSGLYRGGVTDLINRRFSSYPNWPGFYRWATGFAPGKPLMLAEWGVSEESGNPAAKATFFKQLAQDASDWPQVKAFVYWNSPSGRTVGVTRVDSSAASLTAYRQTGKSPYFNP
ncbi:hypothetical protein [Actinopolymorpha alba]|uniref:hypothetical protein n=1 Tax=Actinopolymorpha alba TaxID=533267 RepID=UPI000374B039|nr:hypothetical protein [Actinopolymorpha alba]